MRSPLLFLLFSMMLGGTIAGEFRVLRSGEMNGDARLKPLKDLDGYFRFKPPGSRTEWEARRKELKNQLQVTLGLYPLPTRTPLNAVIHGRIDRGDYVVEKVYFESVPGFFVTGNLYRPKTGGKHAAVLSPHGHWEGGRFLDAGVEGAAREIAQGAETFEAGGRSPLQARCVQLARMGCVVFHYDMLGYADSRQISMAVAHQFAKQRAEMNGRAAWGLFSPQAESHFQSVAGLQTWNSIRALDFLETLPDVDMKRIGVTGASGGGTQTFLLGALDERVSAIFPAVMVSTAMQGGCTCENASGLRVGTGNVEIAGLFAPKPLGMTAADDWTREMERKGFPELQELYRVLKAPENVMLKGALQFGHNFNQIGRKAMYHWFNTHLGLKQREPIEERDFQRLSREELTVWNGEHPQPSGGAEFERGLLQWFVKDAEEQLSRVKELKAFSALVGPALKVVVGRTPEQVEKVTFDVRNKMDEGKHWEIGGMLVNETHCEALPTLFLHPKEWNGSTIVWLHPKGKESSGAGNGLHPLAAEFLSAGATVVGIDLLYQGEFVNGEELVRAPKVANPREAVAYTYGYNYSLSAKRAHDLLSLLSFIKNHEQQSKQVIVIAHGNTASLAAAAWALGGDLMSGAALELDGFRFTDVMDIYSPELLPGGGKYGDVDGMLAVGAGKLLVRDERPLPMTERFLGNRFKWSQAFGAEEVSAWVKDLMNGQSSSASE
ncbi:MAG: acetylxylan esterase [Verrucomicrobiota bacterium]|nr:acetylxylan esterase [Verrucomicrobiota bacterium]